MRMRGCVRPGALRKAQGHAAVLNARTGIRREKSAGDRAPWRRGPGAMCGNAFMAPLLP